MSHALENTLLRLRAVLNRISTRLCLGWRLGHLGKKSSVQAKRIVGAERIFIGERVQVLWGVRLETTQRPGHPLPKLELQNGVTVGQNSHITCAETIIIGAGVALTANVTVTDTNHTYSDRNQPIQHAPIETAPVRIGENSIVLNGAVILPGTTIGKHCVVGANSVVKGQFGDNCIIAGAPARVVKRFDSASQNWLQVN